MKLIGSTENEITKDTTGENLLHIEKTEVVLVHCNIFNNDYKQDSKALYTFTSNKLFDNLLEIPPTNFISLKIFNSEFQTVEVWFTDQNSQQLVMEDGINLTVLIK